MNLQDKIDLFTQLGLSPTQAKVYLALANYTSCTANQISKISYLPTNVVYRTMPKLEEKGLAEKTLTAPKKFMATPMKPAMEMLLEQKKREDAKIRKKARQILSNGIVTQLQPLNGLQKDSNFVVVPGKEVIIKKLKKALRATQSSLDVITSYKRFSQAIVEFAGEYKKALKRGVRIRIATEEHVAENKALEIIWSFAENPSFQVKYFSGLTKAIVSIFDEKEAYVSMSATATLNGTSSIWSNNSSFMALAQNYFENKWNISKKSHFTAELLAI